MGKAGYNEEVLREVRRVRNMAADGLPRHILLDTAALCMPDGTVPRPLYQKLRSLAVDQAILITMITDDARRGRDALFELPNATAVTTPPEMHEPAIAIYGAAREPQANVHAWYVGAGQRPEWMRSNRVNGPAGTDVILGFFGTSIVQERAGAAFRAAGNDAPIPERFAYTAPAILEGISVAVSDTPAEKTTDGTYAEQVAAFEQGDLDGFMERAYGAIEGACAPNGAIAAAAAPQTTKDPNYWFFWQRDAGQIALGMHTLASATSRQALRADIQDKLGKYFAFAARLPDVVGEDGLGISRCTVDGAPIRTYGNPQHDGPAHTALAMLTIGANDAATFTATKPYLDFLASSAGSGLTFDAWEFSVGTIFNAVNLARRALRLGATLAMSHDAAASKKYHSAAKALEETLATFYDADRGYVVAGKNVAIPWMATVQNLDIAVIGSTLTAYDVSVDCMNVDDPRIRQTMAALEHAFADRWPVNRTWRKSHEGMGMGRFPEDMNDGIGSSGGNPWTFATLWAAQYYLRLIQRFDYLGKPDAGEYARQPLLAKAEGYISFVLAHEPTDALSEQIDGQTGQPRGARKLAWAHAELINTLALSRQLRANR